METIKKFFGKHIASIIAFVVIIADLYLAYTLPSNLVLDLFQDKIGAEELGRLEYNYGQLAGLPAGEGVPVLENIDQFYESGSLDYITFETDSIIPLPLYRLKSEQDRMAKGRKGQTIRQRPTYTDGSFIVENVYNRYYLVKLPDGNYVISYLDDSYYVKYRLKGKVQLPLGRVDYMTANEEEYLGSYIEEYGLEDRLLDMFAEERYEENDFLNIAVALGVFFGVLILYIVLATLVSSIFGKMRGRKE